MAAAKPGEIADRSLEFFNQVRDSGSERVGAWTDDPDNKAGVFAAVHRGKLKELVIPNSYMGLDPTTLSTILNAVIINAYIEWTPAQQSARANAARQQGAGDGA